MDIVMMLKQVIYWPNFVTRRRRRRRRRIFLFRSQELVSVCKLMMSG
jgi:hypothetical protein